ncbi:MAG: hypothetical protein E6K65_07110 [Nitrospirae bacterium]|nr:MAG: hypothetical protein E6K65_07110 [Nitrospirota bacterium]
MTHRLTYRRTNHENLQVRGHNEEGTPSTLSNGGNQATRPVSRPSKPGAARLTAPGST